MAHEKTMLALSVVATTCAILSMFLTASIALKCNGKITRKIEDLLGIDIADADK